MGISFLLYYHTGTTHILDGPVYVFQPERKGNVQVGLVGQLQVIEITDSSVGQGSIGHSGCSHQPCIQISAANQQKGQQGQQ